LYARSGQRSKHLKIDQWLSMVEACLLVWKKFGTQDLGFRDLGFTIYDFEVMNSEV
jgi:hypothetical protein